MLKVYSLLFLVATGVSTSWAQSPPDTLQAQKYSSIADSLKNSGKYDSSAHYYGKAADIYKVAEDWEQYIHALNNKVKSLYGYSYSVAGWELAKTTLKLSKEYLGANHLETARALCNTGRHYKYNEDYGQAKAFFIEALQIRLNQLDSNHVTVADSYYELGSFFYKTEAYEESLDFYNASLNIYRKAYGENSQSVANVYYNLGGIYTHIHDFERAINYSKKSLIIRQEILGKTNPMIGSSMIRIGLVYDFLGLGYEAKKYYESALRIYKISNHPFMAIAYANMSSIDRDMGAYDQALMKVDKALGMFLSEIPQNHYRIAVSFNEKGTAYLEKGDYDLALQAYENALLFWDKLEVENINGTSFGYNNIGGLFEKLGEYTKALDFHFKALTIQKNNNNNDPSFFAFTFYCLANTYKSMGLYDIAIGYYERAITIQGGVLVDFSVDIVKSYQALGNTYLNLENYQKALDFYQKSLVVNVSNYTDSSIYSNPLIETCMNQTSLLKSLQLKAETLIKRYDHGKDLRDLQFSLETFQLCDTLIDKIRQSHQWHSDKVAFGKSSAQVYEGAIRVSLKLHKTTGEQTYLDQAFYFSERNKAAVLNESLSGQQARQFVNLPDSVLELEQLLKAEVSYYHSQIQEMTASSSGYDTTQLTHFENNHFESRERLDSLKVALERNNPRYHEMKYENSILNPSQVQQRLSPNQALVSFYEGENEMVRFMLTNRDFQVDTISKDSVYTTNETDYLGSFDWGLVLDHPQQAYRQFTSSANGLYEKLLEPVVTGLPSEVNQLIIVPDGKLSYVPWDLFIKNGSSSTSEIDYKNLDYLFNDYAVSYAHSASLLYQDFQPTKKVANESVLAFAPTYAEGNESYLAMAPAMRSALVPLAWNSSELEAIAGQYEGNYYSGTNATEKTFKENAGDYQVLHLAMHALVDNDKPMESGLVFSQDSDSTEDGTLHNYELFNMELSAEMTVLSACNTGIGKLQKGEGVMSLGRAFSYAGCPSIVMSHWSVDDESTSKLMSYFYKNLSKHQSKDEAMRAARKSYLAQSSIKQHPLYWGGFVVLGDTKPLSTTNQSIWLIGLFVILIILTLGVAISRMREKKSKSLLTFFAFGLLI